MPSISYRHPISNPSAGKGFCRAIPDTHMGTSSGPTGRNSSAIRPAKCRRHASSDKAPTWEHLQAQRAEIPQPSPAGWVSGPPSHAAQRAAIPADIAPHIASLQAANPPRITFPGRWPGLRNFGPLGLENVSHINDMLQPSGQPNPGPCAPFLFQPSPFPTPHFPPCRSIRGTPRTPTPAQP